MELDNDFTEADLPAPTGYSSPFSVHHLRLQRFQQLQRIIGRYVPCALSQAAKKLHRQLISILLII